VARRVMSRRAFFHAPRHLISISPRSYRYRDCRSAPGSDPKIAHSRACRRCEAQIARRAGDHVSLGWSMFVIASWWRASSTTPRTARSGVTSASNQVLIVVVRMRRRHALGERRDRLHLLRAHVPRVLSVGLDDHEHRGYPSWRCGRVLYRYQRQDNWRVDIHDDGYAVGCAIQRLEGHGGYHVWASNSGTGAAQSPTRTSIDDPTPFDHSSRRLLITRACSPFNPTTCSAIMPSLFYSGLETATTHEWNQWFLWRETGSVFHQISFIAFEAGFRSHAIGSGQNEGGCSNSPSRRKSEPAQNFHRPVLSRVSDICKLCRTDSAVCGWNPYLNRSGRPY